MTGDFLLVRTGETLDYGFDWSEWLDGATIQTSVWRIGPSGPTLSGDESTDDTTKVYAEFLAAHAGKKFVLQNIVADTDGAIGTRSIVLRCILGADLVDAGDPPDQFTFVDLTDADRSTEYTSAAVQITGLDDTAPISVSGGTYSINGGAFTAATGTVGNDDEVQVKRTSSSSYSTTVGVTLTVLGVSDTFTVTTMADPDLDYAPSLDFSDGRNSQYIALLEDI